MAEDFSADGMLDMYLYENGQLLEQLEATTLEKKDADSFDEADINEFFRVMHTIKGSSGIMMFDDIMMCFILSGNPSRTTFRTWSW